MANKDNEVVKLVGEESIDEEDEDGCSDAEKSDDEVAPAVEFVGDEDEEQWDDKDNCREIAERGDADAEGGVEDAVHLEGGVAFCKHLSCCREYGDPCQKDRGKGELFGTPRDGQDEEQGRHHPVGLVHLVGGEDDVKPDSLEDDQDQCDGGAESRGCGEEALNEAIDGGEVVLGRHRGWVDKSPQPQYGCDQQDKDNLQKRVLSKRFEQL